MKRLLFLTLIFLFLAPSSFAQRKMTVQKERAILNYLKEKNPKAHQRVLRLKQNNKRRYRRMIVKIAMRHRKIMNLKRLDETDRSLVDSKFRLENDVALRVAELKDVRKESEKTKLKSEIRRQLEKIFELKNKFALRTIEKLEAKIKANREKIQKREVKKSEIIERRLEELTEDDLDW